MSNVRRRPENLRPRHTKKKAQELTPFTRKAITWIRRIPSGQVATYGQIAELAENPGAARRVVWILHACAKPYKLPWHRVINSRGLIGFHPASSDYIRQRTLLAREGIEFEFGRAIDLAEFQWKPARRVRKSKSRNSRP